MESGRGQEHIAVPTTATVHGEEYDAEESLLSPGHYESYHNRREKKYSGLFCGVGLLIGVVAVLELCAAVPMIAQHAGSGGAWNMFSSHPKFLVIGDWGRDGKYNQSVVAEAMARKARVLQPDFVVSTGDNFYESGLTSAMDSQFDSSFTNIYNQKELVNVPWHVALGNHDYGEVDDPKKQPNCPKKVKDDDCYYSPIHQLDSTLMTRDHRWHCERSFTVTLDGGRVEIFFIDTTPIVEKYKEKVWADNKGGVLQQSWEDQVSELDGRLARSQAEWKLVVGHHPIKTNHQKELQFDDMVEKVEPILIKHKVSAYMCGHDHNLQHIHDPATGYHQIISGAGSKIGEGFYGDKNSPFQMDRNGFVAVTVKRNHLKVEYMGVDSDDPVFEIHVPKNQ